MKYVIDVIEVEKCPENWTSKDSWPSNGFFKAKTESHCIYRVHAHGVDYISYPEDIFAAPYKDPGEAISETLLLKLVAAASRAEVLK